MEVQHPSYNKQLIFSLSPHYHSIVVTNNYMIVKVVQKYGKRPCTIVQGIMLNFEVLKIHKKSNFDWNHITRWFTCRSVMML